MIKKIVLLASIAGLLTTSHANAQLFGKLQNDIPRDRTGINVFDVIKDDVPYDGLKITLGGAFAMQFQGISHKNDAKNLSDITNNFNLPTANMTLGAQLYDGVKVNLDLFLSSRHHRETWVKGGYLQIDKLDFIKEGFAEEFMKYATIKVGQMETNYGDAHFRRTDNGNALKNPFIENNLMDSYTTELGMEVYYKKGALVSMIGITNAMLDQSVQEKNSNSPAYLAKLGFDKSMNEDFRVRLTGSMYWAPHLTGTSRLYNGDRGGSRYYSVMTTPENVDPITNFATGRINPNFQGKALSLIINPFIKYKGLEFFGTYENASGGNSSKDKSSTRTWSQYSLDLLYRFGNQEQLYVGGKYNNAKGKLNKSDKKSVSIDRFEVAGGWFMTKNILAKVAYVNQKYNDYQEGSVFKGGKFDGLMVEAVISF